MSLLRRRAKSRSCHLHGDNGCEIQGEAGVRERAQDNRIWRAEVLAEVIRNRAMSCENTITREFDGCDGLH